jgi:hypothetical protein
LFLYCFLIPVVANSRRNYHGINRQNTLNDMPIPEGDFFAAHAKKQQKNNAVLAIGVVSLSFSIFLVSS